MAVSNILTSYFLMSTVFLISIVSTANKFERNSLKTGSVEGSHFTSRTNRPDSSLFYFKHRSTTLNAKDFSLLLKMNCLDSIQERLWLRTFLKNEIVSWKNGETDCPYKLLSFQKQTAVYTSIIIALALDDVQQYFLTIDTLGRVIDGVNVSYIKNLSNSDAEYNKERKIYTFSTNVLSTFKGDTISLFSIESVSKLEDPHSSEEIWNEFYETRYVIKPDGKIHLSNKRKQIESLGIGDLWK